MATSNAVSQTDLPEWYQQYTQNLGTQAMNIAQGNNAQPLPAQSVAGFNSDQTAAFDQLRASQGVWQQPLQQAQQLSGQIAPTSAKFVDYAQGAVGAPAMTTSNAIQPWAQGAQDAISGSAQMVSPMANGWANQITNSVSGPTQLNAASAQGYSQQLLNAAGGPAGQSAGQITPYANGAVSAASGPAAEWTANVSKYMSPYTSHVVDNIARLGARNWEDSIMPGVNSSMIGSGQFGSTRNADVLSRAGVNAANDITGQQSLALQAGYNSAASIFGTDANRAQQQQSMLANTTLGAGGMLQGALAADYNRAQQQQQNLVGATRDAGNMYLNSATADADRLQANKSLQLNAYNSAAGTAVGAAAGDAARIQAQQQAQSQAALAGGNMMQGALSADANRIQNQGQLQANTALTGASTAVNALNTGADNLGALGQSYQTMANTDTQGLLNIGSQQQQLQQGGLTTAYNNAMLARTDPWTQLSNATGVINGVQLPKSSYMSGSDTSVTAPNTLQGIGSGLLTAGSILK